MCYRLISIHSSLVRWGGEAVKRVRFNSKLLASFLLISLPTAFAAPSSTLWFIPDPVAWYKRTSDVITGTGLNTQVETLGYALVFTLFAYGALRASYYSRSSEFAALFGRLLLAGAILLSLTPIRSVLHGTWVSAFGWSSGIFGDVQEELVDAAGGVSLLLAPFFAAGAVVQTAGRRVAQEAAEAAVEVGASSVAGAASRASRYMNGVLLLFFPLFGMYAVLVYASGFVVLLGMLLLPLAGALIMLPNGASWISRWLGMYVGALFTIIFLPIIFGIAIDLGMVQPLAQMGTHMQDALTQFGDAAQALNVPSGAEVWKVGEWQNWLQGIPDSLLSLLGGITSILLGWLLSLVGLIVGMLIGVYLLMNLQGLIGGFIGGVGASAAAAFALSRPPGGSSKTYHHTTSPLPPPPSGSGPSTVPAPKPGGARP